MVKKSIILFTMMIACGILFSGPLMAQKKDNPDQPKLNTKFLVGRWKAIDASLVNPPAAAEPEKTVQPADTSKSATSGRRGGNSADQKAEREAAMIDNFVKNEKNSAIEIFENKTAKKYLPTKTIDVTWKLKKKKLLAKDSKTKEKYTMKIMKWGYNDLDVIEIVRGAQVSVHYIRDNQ